MPGPPRSALGLSRKEGQKKQFDKWVQISRLHTSLRNEQKRKIAVSRHIGLHNSYNKRLNVPTG